MRSFDHSPSEATKMEREASPENPVDRRSSKRHKDNRIRTRVSRACDRCKRRKTRCSGTKPCTFCTQLKLDCKFTAEYRRGQLPAVEGLTEESSTAALLPSPSSGSVPDGSIHQSPEAADDSGSFPALMPELESAHNQFEPDAVSTTNVLTEQLENNSIVVATGDEAQNEPPPYSMRNSPEPSQTDQQGHFVGPASGVSFLLRIQKKLHKQSFGSTQSSIFTFGDRPLPGHDSSFVMLPPKQRAEAMVRRYFDFAIVTHRFLHRPSVEAWLEELYATDGVMHHHEKSRSRIALLFMLFAHSTSFVSSKDATSSSAPSESAALSARFFSVAEHQLSLEKGEIHLSSIQARLAQCFYLLAQSRLNHCWALFGITAHLILALGIHRKSRFDFRNGGNIDYVELETRKRTFWCAYSLNTYLSAALGRPMTFHDEDIDQELPSCVDEAALSRRQISPPTIQSQSIMSAPVAHAKLCKIISRILRSMYGVKVPSTGEHLTLANKYMAELEAWREDISYLLDTDHNSAIFIPLVLRQRDVLKLAFWHAQILVHRPFLLKTFASLSGNKGNQDSITSQQKEIEKNVQVCISAAMQVVAYIDRIDAAGEFYNTLFFIPYYGFSAVVILYVYVIQQRTSSPDVYLRFFNAASRCHTQIEQIAAPGSLMQRYGVVLTELRRELLRNNSYLASLTGTEAIDFTSPMTEFSNHIGEYQHLAGRRDSRHASYQHQAEPRGQGIGLTFVEGNMVNRDLEKAALELPGFDLDSPGMAQIASWGQFDSLVTGGTGRLHGFFLDGINDVWEPPTSVGLGAW